MTSTRYTNNRPAPAADLSEYVFGKVPPQAPDLEQAVLGAVLLDRDALPAIIDLLKPESFYTEANALIYRACVALYAASEPIDILTVGNHLRTKGQADVVGGSAYLVELTNRVASAANLEYHARIVAQKALQRDMIALANRTIQQAYEEGTDAFELLNQAQKSLFDLANFGGRMAEGVGRIGLEVVRRAGESMQKPDGVTGVPSGLMAVDKTTGGWQPNDLIVLAARPGMGKTAFVLQAAKHAADTGTPTAFFSLEMSKGQLTQRLISAMTGISSNSIQRGRITADDLRRMDEAAQRLADTPLFIDDTPGINIFELRAKARRLKMQHGIGLVIIDYLQLMSGENEKGANREQVISSISRGCKALAKDLGVPVIALSQLSRAVEIRGGAKRPQLSDLRESGAIEQDADIVAFLYRPEYYGIEQDEAGNSLKGVAELIIAKHRNGAIDDIGLRFDGPTTSFSDMSKAQGSPKPTAPAPLDYTIPAAARPGIEEEIPF